MNVYIFDVCDSEGEIEVALMTTAAPDASPVVVRRFHGTQVHKVFDEVATMIAAERKKRQACKVVA